MLARARLGACERRSSCCTAACPIGECSARRLHGLLARIHRPRAAPWQSDADSVVKPVNTTESMQQWTNVYGIDQIADFSDTVAGV